MSSNRWARAGQVLFSLFVALVALTELAIIIFGALAKPLPADCAIILGCSVHGERPTPFLAARIEEGMRLYQSGQVHFIIASGGKGPGEEISEAEAIRDYLIARGVSPDRILLEERSLSTRENIRDSLALMRQNHLSSAVIISNRFHLLRAALFARQAGLAASFSGVFLARYPADEAYGYLREVPALWRLILAGR